MRLREMVAKLVAQGVNVKFKERSDGSIIVTAIDDILYKGKKGNQAVRDLLGEALTKRQIQQLQTVSRQLAKTPKAQRGQKLQPLPKELKSQLQKAQRLFRKYNPQGKVYGKYDRSTITTKNVRYVLETEGYEEAMKKVKLAQKYAIGEVYTGNVEILIKRLQGDLDKETDVKVISDINRIIDDLNIIVQNDGKGFKEEQLSDLLHQVYEWEDYKITTRTLLFRWLVIKKG